MGAAPGVAGAEVEDAFDAADPKEVPPPRAIGASAQHPGTCFVERVSVICARSGEMIPHVVKVLVDLLVGCDPSYLSDENKRRRLCVLDDLWSPSAVAGMERHLLKQSYVWGEVDRLGAPPSGMVCPGKDDLHATSPR